jgi:23S rRNA pseudouridine2605 synthase
MKNSFGKKPSSGGSGKSYSSGKKPFGKSSKSGSGDRFGKSDKPFRKSSSGYGDADKPRRKFDDEKPKRSFGSSDDKPRRSYGSNDDKPRRKFDGDKPYGKSSSGYGNDKPRRKFDDEKPKRSFGSSDDKPRRSYGSNDDKPRRKFDGDKPYGKSSSSYGSDKPRRKFDDEKPKRSFGSSDDKPRRSYGSNDERPRRKFDDEKPKRSFGSSDDKPRRSYGSNDDKPRRKFDDEKPKRSFGSSDEKPRRSYGSSDEKPRRKFDDEKPKRSYGSSDNKPRRSYGSNDDKPRRKFDDEKPARKSYSNDEESSWEVFEDNQSASDYVKKTERPAFKKSKGAPSKYAEPVNGSLRLNRFIANTGLCSRREADELIAAGVVKVNGKIVTELGTKISASDTVHYGDQLLRRERLQYVLLNKPKDFITTTDDPQERKTVLQLVSDACEERIYPVGRLDRNTTGLLLLTNDGDLAEHLMHPRYGIRKIYHVTLDKTLNAEDFAAIENGIELEDGPIKADELSYVGEGGNKKEVGIVLHSGRNRIVRRIFEHLGYQVVGLDRVVYAGLTKKNLPRSRWRHLTEEEVGLLKMNTGSGTKKVKAKAPGYRKKKSED